MIKLKLLCYWFWLLDCLLRIYEMYTDQVANSTQPLAYPECVLELEHDKVLERWTDLDER